MSSQPSLMTFPCDFILKIIGKDTPLFVKEIGAIIRQFYPNTCEKNFTIKRSENNTYVAISVSLHILDQRTLDAVYQELVRHPDVKMVL